MPDYQIEMLWRCSTCEHENLGRHKKCQGCGKALEGEEFYMPGDTSPAAAVKDPDLLEQALAGADWHCAYCRSSQRRDDGTCANCGASQDEAKPDVPPDSSLPPTSSPASSTFIPPPPLPMRMGAGTRAAAIASLVALAVALCLWLVFRTKVVDVHVSSVHWERRVLVERYQVLHKEGWDRDPGSFNERDLGQRVHHYNHVIDHYRTESYTVQVACGQTCTPIPRSCYTTPRVCTSNKNGFASCSGGDQVCSGGGQSCSTRYCSEPRTRQVPVYRDDPVYRTWWAWDVWGWKQNRVVKEDGSTPDARWPSDQRVALGKGLADGEKERQSREEEYSVTFTDGDDSWKYEPKGYAEFREDAPGTRHRIKVGVAHGVEVMKPGAE